MSQAVPWTTYHGDQHIARGFDGFADAIQRGASRRQQQQQFEKDQELERYAIDVRARQAAAEMSDWRPPWQDLEAAKKAGFSYMAQSPRGGSYLPVPTQQGGGDSGPIKGKTVIDEAGKVLGHVVPFGGKESFQKAQAAKDGEDTSIAALYARQQEQQRAEKEKALEQARANLADIGAVRGPDWLGIDFGGGADAQRKKVKQLEAELAKPTAPPGMADLPQGGATAPGGTGGPNNNALLPGDEYTTADAVRAAVKAGKLERARALELLRNKFGMK